MLRMMRMRLTQSESLLLARPPMKRSEIRESNTRTAMINSGKVIPDFNLLFWGFASLVVYCRFALLKFARNQKVANVFVRRSAPERDERKQGIV